MTAVADDIVTRLHQLLDGPVPMTVTREDVRDVLAEIERLRAALAIAAGMISTLPPYEDRHPEAVMEMLLEEARRA